MKSGYIDAFLFCLFTAISFNFIDKLDDHINPFISLLFMSIIASLFFSAISYKHIGKMYKAVINNKTLYCIMSLAIGINWLCSIFAPNLSDPFIYLLLLFITMAILGFIFVKKKKNIDYYVSYTSIAVFVFILWYLHAKYFIGQNRNLNIGFILGVVGGMSGYLYAYILNIFVKKTEMNTTQTLSIRLLGLVVLLLIIIMSRDIKMHIYWKDFNILFLMSVLTMIIPNYFSQSSIIKLGAAKMAIFVVFTPLITFIVYSAFSRNFNSENSILAVIITLVMLLSKVTPSIINKIENRC